jgi:hypothetical protein
LKGAKLKKGAIIFILAAGVILGGCVPGAKDRETLTVDFEKDKVLRYEFLSNRQTYVDWGPSKNPVPPKKRPAEYTEFMQLVIAYKPIEVNPYGLSVIEAKCESASVNRTKRGGKESSKTDALTSIAGKTFTFTVGPNGKIADYSQIEQLAREAGEKAFRPRSRAGTIKDPDMVRDFLATQWFLWDPISSIENPIKGVRVGQSWKSQVLLPVPMVMQIARNVTYTLAEIRQSEKGKIAVIKSTYSLADKVLKHWPLPYPDGVFQMSGPFGFFRDYKLLSLEGKGEELFNIDTGQTEGYEQKYELKMQANTPIGINVSPEIFIEQLMRMKLVEDKRAKGATAQ